MTISKWGGLILGIIIGFFLLTKGVFFIKGVISPAKPPPPEAKFGKLPAIIFPAGIKKDFKYSIDTISGELPAFPDRLNVYKIGEEEPDILAVEKMSKRVLDLGFDPKPEQLSDTVYRWTNSSSLQKSLVLNVHRREFNLISNYLFDKNLLSSQNVSTNEEAISTARNLLESLSFYPEDLDESKTKAIPLSVANGTLSEATSISNTRLISVYFFQKDRDEIPIIYPYGSKSTINVTIAGGGFNKEIIDARYFHQNISDESSTYGVITADQAFEKLKKGDSYIYSFDSKKPDVIIKKVYLGYYVEKRVQKYLMPVVIFEGNNNFFGYVSAVTDE